MAFVSVVIPTFNRQNSIERAISSVLSQDGVDFEVIVVDDCSSDATIDIVNAIPDPRVRIVRNKTRLGGAGARNVGIDLSRGEYIAFQDSDDEWLSGKLRKQVSALESANKQVAMNYCAYIRVCGATAEYLPAIARNKTNEEAFERLLGGNFISTQTIVVRKTAFADVGVFDADLPRYQDWDLVLRIANKFDLQFLNEPLVIVYDTPGNISSFKENDFPARRAILKKWEGDERLTSRLMARHEFVMSRVALRCGRSRQATAFGWAAVRGNPFVAKYWGAAIISQLSALGNSIGFCGGRAVAK